MLFKSVVKKTWDIELQIMQKGTKTAETNTEHLLGKLNFHTSPDCYCKVVI